MRIKNITETHYNWLKKMGWHNNTTPLEQIALIASEIGEAANECRGKKPTDKLGAELSDIILRTLGLARRLNIDMEKEIGAKIWHNIQNGKKKGRIK